MIQLFSILLTTVSKKNDCFKEMQKITILDQSFLDSKKKSILQKKKFLAINFSSFQKKILDSGVRSISNKTFFFGRATQKDKKKMTA